MTEPDRPRLSTPTGLDLAGKRVWRRVSAPYELRPDEQVVLETAAKVADTVALLEAAMKGQPLMVKGSMGQMREHPLLSEARQQRALLARLMAQLKLPDVDAPVETNQHRDAATSRWKRPGT